MKRKRIRFNKIRHLLLNELGSKFNLSFSSQEVIGNKILGLDGGNKKLLVLEQADGRSHSYIVDLYEATGISVKKIYSSIKSGELKKRSMQEFLKTVQLLFKFGSGKEDIVLPFYEREIDNVQDLRGLERKIKNWQMILSKMAGLKIINQL